MLLNNHSFFSLRYGTLSIENLVDLAIKNGWNKLLITDINNSSAVVEFVKECKKKDILPAAGIEFRHHNKLLFLAIAHNNIGFRKINEYLSEYNLSKNSIPERAPEISDVSFIYDISNLDLIETLRSNEYIGIRASEKYKLLKVNRKYFSKLVALSPITFANASGFELHKHLRAIDNNLLLSMIKPLHLADSDEIIFSKSQLFQRFSGFEFLLDNAQKIIDSCSLDFDFAPIKNKKHYTISRKDDYNLLRKLAFEGLEYRYGKDNKIAEERVEKELAIIDKLGFSAYFLITYDIISYSLSRGYYHVGRGSGANSVVAYCLKIVDVDPIELDLYFERFINPKRSSPPDFDIDYSWKERDDVQDYIFKRFGNDRVALLGTMSTFKGKSIYRELGKVYGLPKDEIDDLIRNPIADNMIMANAFLINALISGLFLYFATLGYKTFPREYAINANSMAILETPEYRPTS